MAENRRRGSQSSEYANTRRQSVDPDRQRRQEQKRRQELRKKRARRKRRRLIMIMLLLAMMFLMIAVAAVFLWDRYSPSDETYDLNAYYGIEEEGQVAVVIDNQVQPAQALVEDGKVYVQYDLVRDYINSRFYWDSNERKLLYALPNSVITVEEDSQDYTVSKDKKSEDYVIVRNVGDVGYIALDFIKQYTDIEYELYDSPQRVVVNTDWTEKSVSTIKKDTQVRYLGGVKSPVLTEVSNGDKVTVLADESDWKQVATADGFIGYVKTSALDGETIETYSRDFEEPEYTNISKDYTINLVWHNVTTYDANSAIESLLSNTKSVTTVGPTWFYAEDTLGNISSCGSSDYVTYCHEQGVEVWAVIRDFDGGISTEDETYELLSSTTKRTRLIKNLVSEAMDLGVDGINVDFEHVSDACGEHFIEFVRELSVKCRKNGLVLSIDNYVPQGYNMQYDREEQGIVADYVIIMGYDEYYAGSQEAGPVSSYNYVKNGIEATLEEVPAEKVISGIPFFTRLWTISSSVESEALGMEDAEAAVSSADAKTSWDEENGCNFASWTNSDGATCKIWLEDSDSIGEKLQLMKDNNLAGTAEWALGQEDPTIWKLIKKYVK